MDVLELAKQLSALSKAEPQQATDTIFCNEAVVIEDWEVSLASGTLQASYRATPVNAADTLLGVAVALLSADGDTLYCSGTTVMSGGPFPIAGVSLATITNTALFAPTGDSIPIILSFASGIILRAGGTNCPFFFRKQFTFD